MESNSHGRKKHMVEGTVKTITRTGEIVEDAVEEVREDLRETVEAAKEKKESKGFFARIADLFRK